MQKTAQVQNEKCLTVNGEEFKTLANAGMQWLKTNQQVVNSLNVFPVPDGDTGTNMLLTMQSALSESVNGNDTEQNIGKVCQAIARGALMGARGNSGVILSQLWRGFSRAIDNAPILDAKLLAAALAEARNTAYKGVVKPVEGTILTVAKDMAAAAETIAEETEDLCIFLEKLVTAAEESVERTPELLPILKQAKVVDSGGKGLLIILEGMLRYLQGKTISELESHVEVHPTLDLQSSHDSVEPGQDYEVVIDFAPNPELQLPDFYERLEEIGTSVQIGEGDGIYRMHIHVAADKRYAPIDYVMSVGRISKVYIENLMEMVEGFAAAEEDYKKYISEINPDEIAVVAVSPGPGISKIFASLGVAAIIEGGQTMNPSTEEIVAAFEDLPTNKIIILPNNKNIILAANTAKQLSVKQVEVIATKNVPQGFSAMLQYEPEGDITKVAEEMTAALTEVETGEITHASRSAEINNITVEKDSIIAIYNGDLIGSYETLSDAVMEFLEKSRASEKERITFYEGKSLEKEEAEQIMAKVKEQYSSHEIEIQYGGQPYYQYIISVE